MQHKTLSEVRAEADVINPAAITRREKLERWAELLSARGAARLKTLTNVEYALPAHRGPMREDNSILSVAYADPVFRAAGLKDDTYGEAMRFFELGHGSMHKLVCRCHLGSYVSSEKMGARMRRMAQGPFATMRGWAKQLQADVAARFA
jgi:hypothetical protein